MRALPLAGGAWGSVARSPFAAPELQAGRSGGGDGGGGAGGIHRLEPLPELLRAPLPCLSPGKVRRAALKTVEGEGLRAKAET